ncbi:hypothetical protein DUI87_22173 [Hirundo rustica rustica]|uniref:Protein kish-A n=1 Tax=Hirundo rustica rustica TaxID=333673 RepID=A0A3M0JQ83_HIRRU|nr:hypothetical protein DUI87_22173 [Hirundo rustica rustica]
MWRSAARCFKDFISESSTEVFLVGLRSLPHAWMKRGKKLKSAIFNFQSLLTVILLLICTCAYVRSLAPSLLDKNKTGCDPQNCDLSVVGFEKPLNSCDMETSGAVHRTSVVLSPKASANEMIFVGEGASKEPKECTDPCLFGTNYLQILMIDSHKLAKLDMAWNNLA